MTSISPQSDAGEVRKAGPRRWPLFPIGILLFIAGPVIYVLAFRAKHLTLPWYAPALAAAGVVLMGISAWRRRGRWRYTGAALFALICGFEFFMVFVATKSPPYTGPAETGRQIPTFATTLADGTPFTHEDVAKGSPTALVFFRGRW